MLAIYKKELKVYFSGLFGYLLIALCLLFAGVFVALMHLIAASADYAMSLVPMQWVLIILVPFLSMRAIAEERHNRTDLLLYSLPLRSSDIVIGKYLAQLTLLGVSLLPMALYPLLLATMGDISLAAAYVALLGYALMAAALIALCTCLSSLFENQVVAAVVSIAVLLALYFLPSILSLLPAAPIFSFVVCLLLCALIGLLIWHATKSLFCGILFAAIPAIAASVALIAAPRFFDNLAVRVLSAVNPFTRYGGFTYGHLDLPATVCYLTFIGVFLFLTVQSLEGRRRA
mgnify:CR=1 FL=1